MISDANLSRADYPCLQIKINDIIIEIAANSVSRKSVSFNFRLNSKIEVKSKTKLNEIANKLKIVVKMQIAQEHIVKLKKWMNTFL